MTFFQHLQAHKGGIIKLKTQLDWYGGRGLDGNPGRICLILDAVVDATAAATSVTVWPSTAALLLIDGSPQWVWVAEQDMELL